MKNQLLKTRQISVRLPLWIAEALKNDHRSQAKIIAAAVAAYLKITEPKNEI